MKYSELPVASSAELSDVVAVLQGDATKSVTVQQIVDKASGGVSSFNGRTGAIVPTSGDYTAAMVGLENVNNTADINKPVSLATQTELNKKVDKVDGKDLSTNDYTTEEKTKLAGIEAGAQVNTVTSVNGQTGDVNITTVSFHIINEGGQLPDTGVTGGFYFVPNGNTGTNKYDEWVYTNSSWECLGPVEVDLSDYVRKEEIGTAASANTTTSVTSGGTDLPTSDAVYTALQNSAKKPVVVDATLLANGWSDGSQTVTVSGLTATSVGMVSLSMSATAEQRSVAALAELSSTAQTTDSLTITADGDIPTIDIPIQVTILG